MHIVPRHKKSSTLTSTTYLRAKFLPRRLSSALTKGTSPSPTTAGKESHFFTPSGMTIRHNQTAAALALAESLSRAPTAKATEHSHAHDVRGAHDLPPLPEEDEDQVAMNLIGKDGDAVRDYLEARFSGKGKMQEPFKRLYDAAQMKVLATAEFERARAEVLESLMAGKFPTAKRAGSCMRGVGAKSTRKRSLTIGKARYNNE